MSLKRSVKHKRINLTQSKHGDQATLQNEAKLNRIVETEYPGVQHSGSDNTLHQLAGFYTRTTDIEAIRHTHTHTSIVVYI